MLDSPPFFFQNNKKNKKNCAPKKNFFCFRFFFLLFLFKIKRCSICSKCFGVYVLEHRCHAFMVDKVNPNAWRCTMTSCISKKKMKIKNWKIFFFFFEIFFFVVVGWEENFCFCSQTTHSHSYISTFTDFSSSRPHRPASSKKNFNIRFFFLVEALLFFQGKKKRAVSDKKKWIFKTKKNHEPGCPEGLNFCFIVFSLLFSPSLKKKKIQCVALLHRCCRPRFGFQSCWLGRSVWLSWKCGYVYPSCGSYSQVEKKEKKNTFSFFVVLKNDQIKNNIKKIK